MISLAKVAKKVARQAKYRKLREDSLAGKTTSNLVRAVSVWLSVLYKESLFLGPVYIPLSPGSSARSFQNEGSNQSLCCPGGSHPGLGRWSFSCKQQIESLM